MAKGIWPESSNATIAYPFELKIDGYPVSKFTIHDFRGNMLEGLSDDDQDDVDELFDTFEESSCIIILVDGDTIMNAIDPAEISPEHRHNADFIIQLSARNKLNYIESLVQECNARMKKKVPILLAITKSDIFYTNELFAGKNLLKELLPSLFALRNDMIVGITAVTLGENLSNDKGKLTGTLCLNTYGNVHLPVLFALFQEIEKIDRTNDITEVRNLILKLFSNKINFYRGGRPAFIV